jgi:hypothetical protein
LFVFWFNIMRLKKVWEKHKRSTCFMFERVLKWKRNKTHWGKRKKLGKIKNKEKQIKTQQKK